MKTVSYLGKLFPDFELRANYSSVVIALVQMIRNLHPQALYTFHPHTFQLYHPDHITLAYATLEAAAASDVWGISGVDDLKYPPTQRPLVYLWSPDVGEPTYIIPHSADTGLRIEQLLQIYASQFFGGQQHDWLRKLQSISAHAADRLSLGGQVEPWVIVHF
jgi:LmbE family N-acetylglucosaminyl deacetylase